VPLSRAKVHHALLVRLGAPLTLICACLPEDDLASYSRAWTSEPEALLPAPAADSGALPPGSDAGAPPSPPSPDPGQPSSVPDDDAGAARPDAGEPLDAGVEAADASAPAAPEQPPPLADGGLSPDAGP